MGLNPLGNNLSAAKWNRVTLARYANEMAQGMFYIHLYCHPKGSTDLLLGLAAAFIVKCLLSLLVPTFLH